MSIFLIAIQLGVLFLTWKGHILGSIVLELSGLIIVCYYGFYEVVRELKRVRGYWDA